LTAARRRLFLIHKIMADIPPNTPPPGAPLGAEPPMKKTTGKVQPKKETVRINLPPKPTAAPTIKLPTLPPGGPTGASGAPMPAPAPRAAAPIAPPPQRGAAPVAAARPAPVAVTAAPTVSGFDKILALAAMVAALFAIGSVLYLWLGIPTGN
jgi:hypothetical protein